MDESALNAFRALAMADEALQTVLAEPEQPDRFAALAQEAAGRHGIALTADDLREALRPDPLGLSRLAATVPNADQWPPRQWLPVQAVGAVVDWANFAGMPLSEPFFAASARRAMARPFNRLFRHCTALDAFIDNRAIEDSLAPDGFIFHMSRCGSTLVAQMLAALPGSVVVSEARPLDAIVRLGVVLPPARRAEALRAMVAALGRRRSEGDRRYFLKLDFRQTVALPLFRKVFPAVPWIFLYRDPVAVLESQMRQRGIETLPELAAYPGVFGDAGTPAEESCAQILAEICEAAIAHLGTGGGLSVNYADLPNAIAPILSHFGIHCGGKEQAAMAAAARRDAKSPGIKFVPDAAAKQRAGTGLIRSAAARHLAEPYGRLEMRRHRSS
jgi:hypothetical protein